MAKHFLLVCEKHTHLVVLTSLLIVWSMQFNSCFNVSKRGRKKWLPIRPTLKLWPRSSVNFFFLRMFPIAAPSKGCVCIRYAGVCVRFGSLRVWHWDGQLKPVPAAKDQWEQGADALPHRRCGNANQMHLGCFAYACVCVDACAGMWAHTLVFARVYWVCFCKCLFADTLSPPVHLMNIFTFFFEKEMQSLQFYFFEISQIGGWK